MSETPRTDALWDAWASEKLPSGQFRYGPADLADLARGLERELTAEREHHAETRKDYLCLAELLNGHDATECRANLEKLKAAPPTDDQAGG